MTATIIIVVALLLGAGLVISQLIRLREWLGKPPADVPPDTEDEGSQAPPNS